MTSTGLNVQEGNVDQMMMNAPIKISDVASMFRRSVPKNERPLERSVMNRNNLIVDDWYNLVLKKICDNQGNVPVLRVNPSFQYYFEGLEMKNFQKYRDHLPSYKEEDVLFWINFFMTSPIETIHNAGISVVSAAWGMITGALRTHFVDKRWEVVYSKSDDPLVWDKLANNNPHVMNGRPLPFGLSQEDLSDIETKVMVVLKNPIGPK